MTKRFKGRRQLCWLALALCISAASCGGDAEPEQMSEPAGGAITLWTDSTELFMEHPALIVGAPDRFAIHLTDLTDFAPLRSGRVTLTFVPRDGGEPVVVTQEAPRSPGIFGASPEFSRAGLYDLTLLVESPQARDSISIQALRVYANASEAPRDSGGGDDGIAFLKEQQWKTPGFATAFARDGSMLASIAAGGEIIAAAGREAVVAAPIAGLIDAASLRQAPATGQRVESGQVLAMLTPVLGEGGTSAYAQARAALREAQDEYDRARRLYEVEAVPQRRLHEAESRLRAAREALAGISGGDSVGAGGRVALRSPIRGMIVSRSAAPGNRVDAGAPLFAIVDPSVVWLKVSVAADDAPLVRASSRATFRAERLPREYPTGRLISAGAIIDSLSRTVPMIYEVSNGDGSLRIGSVVQAAIRTGESVAGVIVPTSAILDEDGRAIVYVQPEGERFERREVVVGATHGRLALVTSGLRAGERVVTGAAPQVRLASLSTAVPSHGHEH